MGPWLNGRTAVFRATPRPGAAGIRRSDQGVRLSAACGWFTKERKGPPPGGTPLLGPKRPLVSGGLCWKRNANSHRLSAPR